MERIVSEPLRSCVGESSLAHSGHLGASLNASERSPATDLRFIDLLIEEGPRRDDDPRPQASWHDTAALIVLNGAAVINRNVQRHWHQEPFRFLNPVEAQVSPRKASPCYRRPLQVSRVCQTHETKRDIFVEPSTCGLKSIASLSNITPNRTLNVDCRSLIRALRCGHQVLDYIH